MRRSKGAAEQASGGVKKSFLGFPKSKCLKCGFDNLYPASPVMIVIYVILALALIPMLKVAVNGGVFSPVWIFVAICGVLGIITTIRTKKASYGDKFVALERGERIFTFHCSACRGSIEAEEQMKGAQTRQLLIRKLQAIQKNKPCKTPQIRLLQTPIPAKQR